jgi:hypothetical protein
MCARATDDDSLNLANAAGYERYPERSQRKLCVSTEDPIDETRTDTSAAPATLRRNGFTRRP